MNFSEIPDHVLLKIFRFLSTRDFIRLGRVNEQFRKISIEASSQMTSIDLTDKIFEEITDQQLASLFEKCWNELKRIKFRPRRRDFIEIFEQFSFSQLVELDLSDNDVDGLNFGKLIRQNKNIEILKSASLFWRFNFPGDVIGEKLLAVEVQRADEDFFVSLTGRCPNLTSLAISELLCAGLPQTRVTAMLNDFFSSCSKLTKFSTKAASMNLALMRVDSFWRLNLREIAVRFHYDFDETVFDKFICSFRNLEAVSFDDGSAAPEMVSKLASLPKLRRLSLPYGYFCAMDQSVLLFVGSEVLQHLEVPAAFISPTTLKGFILRCPQLSFLWTRGIKDVKTVQDAANFIRSLNEFSASRSCHLAIRFCGTFHKIWESKEVKDALKGVEEKLMFEMREG